jgi:hypothetical protein
VPVLAAYLPQEGVVLAQMQVKAVGHEASSAPTLLSTLDLRGTVVSGDANVAARALSEKILRAKGDDLWVIKENQSQMCEDRETLFAPQQNRPGCSAPPMDFREAAWEDHGHGRWETRQIIVSSLLASYSLWPGLSQAFKLERSRSNALGKMEQETA